MIHLEAVHEGLTLIQLRNSDDVRNKNVFLATHLVCKEKKCFNDTI